MFSSRQNNILCVLSMSVLGNLYVSARAETSEAPDVVSSHSVPLILDISRRSLKNFLEDEAALERYLGPDGALNDLEDAFTIGAVHGRYALIWDATACRLVGVIDIKPPSEEQPGDPPGTNPDPNSPYVLLAEGYPPLSGSLGTFGHPSYFGFRLIDGLPEFLYTHGSLQVEERLWLEGDGRVLKQRFAIRSPENPFLLHFPASWKERIVKTSAGKWNGGTLSVPHEKADEVIITYRLSDQPAPKEPN